MDIYRYFHPHHNPRLFSTPLRQQELSELEQAAAELKKAIERARLRTERAPAGRILPSHFIDVLKAIRFIESSLQTLCDAHDGDSPEVLQDIVRERSGMRGWEAWTSIVNEQLSSDEHPRIKHSSVAEKNPDRLLSNTEVKLIA
jgi:type II secretory pathway pseudopilin PulG